MSSDEDYIRREIELADEAAAAGDVPIGAVLVSGDLVLEAKNEKESRPDATAHAEMLLIQEASRRFGAWPRLLSRKPHNACFTEADR